MPKSASPTSRRTCVTFMCDPKQISQLRQGARDKGWAVSQYVRWVLYAHLEARYNKSA